MQAAYGSQGAEKVVYKCCKLAFPSAEKIPVEEEQVAALMGCRGTSQMAPKKKDLQGLQRCNMSPGDAGR